MMTDEYLIIITKNIFSIIIKLIIKTKTKRSIYEIKT